MNCPKCGAKGWRVKLIEQVCGDEKPRYSCSNFFKGKCDVEYFNEDGVF